jgi:hypothetical protein
MSKPPMVGFAANLCLDDLIHDLGDPCAPHRLFPQGRDRYHRTKELERVLCPRAQPNRLRDQTLAFLIFLHFAMS